MLLLLLLLLGVLESSTCAANQAGARVGPVEFLAAPALLALFLGAWARRRPAPIALGLSLAALAVAVLLAAVPVRAPEEKGQGIVVHKSRRELTLVCPGQRPRRFRIALSSNPAGDKAREGDLRVPVGRFWITDMAVGPPFHRWLELSYPSLEHAGRGRLEHRITWVEWWLLRFQGLNRLAPLQRTALGGAIGIHGGGARRDWTLGCIALDNRDAESLYSLVERGTPVEIRP
ncbi:MAG: L,D-transpeptidase [Armatimonadetes bacterium]|nr:L,D-transpeptidase [Armatimonadota bacterium]